MNHQHPLPLIHLPNTLPPEGSISIEMVDQQPILRAAKPIQDRIEQLLEQQQTAPLTPQEEQELDDYEALDDYLSLVNRTMRNLQYQPLAS